ncbi:3-hydroxyacyl-[acyl-carrier-protein] dehydratase, FabA form @ Trans-2-decenoyl-[acyl-carrier-protein] isomerase [hydrothermal vent metagenome]|uniref:3-hydroxydecanoyl-[acyl-carrier-protein] dehydratase n=1 Tax=hydrothermal vent metagenome TaxID=652676 RepID=A0A3B0S4F0_9ZZZZ
MFEPKSSYDYDDLIRSGNDSLFGPGNAKLPLPPMLMMDRITNMQTTGGEYDKGFMEAELDVNPDLWFFKCHFSGDPVMPGCLGLDAVWQMVGFYLGWTGAQGRGRALGVGEVKFRGTVIPGVQKVQYRIDLKRIINRRLILGIADGKVLADGEVIYAMKDLRVGLFQAPENE